jgi:hypothetical protein
MSLDLDHLDGVRAMRAVHELGGTVRDIGVLEAAIRNLELAGDLRAATVAYGWYAELFGDEEKAA